MDKNRLEFEKGMLAQIKEIIINEISYLKHENEEIPKKYRHRYSNAAGGGDEDLIDHLINLNNIRILKLERMLENSYFGKIEYTEENGNQEKFYIGKTSITDDKNNMLVLDWRSDICSLYYEQDLGNVQYATIDGVHEGFLNLKSQIIINDGELQSVIDTDMITQDELILPFLKVNATDKMRDIVASIQKEQNMIIRYPQNQSIIVQGVAGSGKTSVALHRIAYLLYQNSQLKPEHFLVIGPNDCFNNYISNVLPNLDSEWVGQLTFNDLLNIVYNDKTKVIKQAEDEVIAGYKNSIDYKNDIDNFLNEMLDNIDYTLVVEGIEIFDSSKIKTYLSSAKGSIRDRIDIAISKTITYIKEYADQLENSVFKILEKSLSQSSSQEEKKLVYDKKVKIRKILKSGCKDEVKKIFSKFKQKPLEIYRDFIKHFDKYCCLLSDEKIQELQTSTVNYLNKKSITSSDIAALLYINVEVSKSKINGQYKHVVIDEAQDLGLFQFYILKKLYSNAVFSIYGDIAQSIYSYKSIDDWNVVNEKIFGNTAKQLILRHCYRTTAEITEESNKVLKNLQLVESEPVLRHGIKVKYINQDYFTEIELLLDKKYESIAIICKDEKEKEEVFKKLGKRVHGLHLVHKDDLTYNGGVCIIDVEASKGLEFDAVIINDASDKKYTQSIVDQKKLYVSMTRALHELIINYDTDLTKTLQSDNKVYKIDNR